MADRDLRITTSVDLSGISAGMSAAQGAVGEAAASMRASFTSVKEATQALKQAQQQMAAVVAAVGGAINEQNAAWGVYAEAQQQAAAASQYLAAAQTAEADAANTAAAANDRLQYGMAYGTARIASYAGGVGSLGYALGSVAGRSQVLAPILSAIFPVAAAAAVADIVYRIADGVKRWYDNAVLLKGQLSDLLKLDYSAAAQATETHWQVIQQQIAALRANGDASRAVALLQQHIGEKPVKLDLKIAQKDLDALDRVSPGIRTLVNELQAPDLTLQKAADHLDEIQQQLANMRDIPSVLGNLMSEDDLERLRRAQAALESVTYTIRNEQTLGTGDIAEAQAAAQRKAAETAQQWAQRSIEANNLVAESERQLETFFKDSMAATAKASDAALAAQRKKNEELKQTLAQQAEAWDRIRDGVRQAADQAERYDEGVQRLHQEQAQDLVSQMSATAKKTPVPFDAQVAARGLTTVGDSFDRMMQGVMMGTQRMGAAWRRMWAEMAAGAEAAIIKVLTKQLAMEITTTAQHAAAKQAQVATDATAAAQSNAIGIAGAMSQIARDAAQAATGAFKAVVGIPVVGPILAGPAAGAAYAGAIAYGALASAAGGQWEVPGAEQLTMLHRSEMVLPAGPAEGLRRLVGSGGAGGSTHFHMHANINAVDARGVRDMLHDHAPEFAAAFHQHLRARNMA